MSGVERPDVSAYTDGDGVLHVEVRSGGRAYKFEGLPEVEWRSELPIGSPWSLERSPAAPFRQVQVFELRIPEVTGSTVRAETQAGGDVVKVHLSDGYYEHEQFSALPADLRRADGVYEVPAEQLARWEAASEAWGAAQEEMQGLQSGRLAERRRVAEERARRDAEAVRGGRR